MNQSIRSMIVIAFVLAMLTGSAEAQLELLRLDGWKRGAPLAGVDYVYDKSNGKSGARSLSLQKSAQKYFPIAQWFRTLPYEGELGGLKITCQIRAENATNVEAQDPKENPELDNKVEIKIGKAIGHYLSVPARTRKSPENGHGLLVVLPAGDGSADFHPFVSNIHANALGDDYVLTQPLPIKWTDDRTKMVDYAGGHGWRGDVFGNIQAGVNWLEGAAGASDEKK